MRRKHSEPHTNPESCLIVCRHDGETLREGTLRLGIEPRECSGSIKGIACTVDAIGVEGRIVLTGQSMSLVIPIELGKLIWKHAEIVGPRGSPRFFPKTLDYMSKRLVDVNPIIAHIPLNDVQKAFEMGNKATESGKILLQIGD